MSTTRKNYRVTIEVTEWAYKEQYAYMDSPCGEIHPAGSPDWKPLYQQTLTDLNVSEIVRIINSEEKQ